MFHTRPRLFWLALALPFATASCAGLDRVARGALQPQTVAGPCQVKKFFLVNLTVQHTNLTIANQGQACSFTLVNPDLQIFNTAALVTEPAMHGLATAGLLSSGVQAGVSYTPQPGYAGPDAFSVTVEPGDRAVRVHVTVQPG